MSLNEFPLSSVAICPWVWNSITYSRKETLDKSVQIVTEEELILSKIQLILLSLLKKIVQTHLKYEYAQEATSYLLNFLSLSLHSILLLSLHITLIHLPWQRMKKKLFSGNCWAEIEDTFLYLPLTDHWPLRAFLALI